jgi:hypothetical protein
MPEEGDPGQFPFFQKVRFFLFNKLNHFLWNKALKVRSPISLEG